MDKKRDTAMTSETGDGDYEQVKMEYHRHEDLIVFVKTDVNILNEGEVLVPEKPEPRSRDEIRTTILKKYQNAIRPPGTSKNQFDFSSLFSCR